MPSGSTSPASDVSSGIPESDSEEMRVVMGLPAAVGAHEEQMCIGGGNKWVHCGWCTDQGKRKHMEDRHVIIPAFLSLPCDTFGGCTAPRCGHALESTPVHYFAVFDGHGGSQASDYCMNSMHEALKEAWETDGGCTNKWNEKWQSAFYRAYEKVNKACVDESDAGSTALVVLVSSCQILAANCGDSRAVLSRGTHTIPLTMDHKPDREDEEERIAKIGGRILSDGWGTLRVDGVLAMTRAIGDKTLKPSVSSVPELTYTIRSEDDECLIIATDGLWDALSTEEVGDMACDLLRKERQVARTHKTPSQYVAECLLKEARKRKSTDNFCVIVVDLKPTKKH